MIIVKTEIEIGTYLKDSSIDGRPLRQIKSMEDLDGLSDNDYEIVKTDRIIPIHDLNKAKQEELNKIQKQKNSPY